jgi:multidrug efflux pump subunit AcrB
MVISEIGVVPDLSAAYTPNAGPMDAVIKVQLGHERHHSAQEWVLRLREGFAADRRFADLEFGFDAGGMIRAAMNRGKSTPVNVRVTAKEASKARSLAEAIRLAVVRIEGVVDARTIQRFDYPQYVIDVDRAKAADLGLSQAEVMKNVVAALNSSIQFHKKNFWIDPVSKNQYFVGVQYFEEDIDSVQTLLDVPLTSPKQDKPIPLRNIATLMRNTVPTEITHNNMQTTVDLVMGVEGRDLGHVAVAVARALGRFGDAKADGTWLPYDPDETAAARRIMKGARIELSGEYGRMQETFRSLGSGLVLASLLMYFLMAALDKSYVVPFTVMLTVPLCLVGVLPMLFYTGTALNVQSLLGIIFIVGIKVANTVLMTDYAQELRRHEGLTPTEAIRKAAVIRVRPVTMTALAAFFAMVPMALAMGRGSEANAPLGRAILGGLLAGEPATLFVLPALYSLLVRDQKRDAARRLTAADDVRSVP